MNWYGKRVEAVKKFGLVRSDYTIAEAEEISNRTQNTWELRIVPGYLQQAFAVVVALSHPYVRDLAGTFDVRKNTRLARTYLPGVAIAPLGVP